jgi:hypothetical protein
MAKAYNNLYAVGLYLAVVWVLYGRREVLPKSVIKALDTDQLLKADKRDPKKEDVYYTDEVGKLYSGKSAVSLYDLAEKLKAEKK